jgi:hypothetical protein
MATSADAAASATTAPARRMAASLCDWDIAMQQQRRRR